ncbi:MAG: 1-acyl-sn-glycerol-3-phosphate acyltransferase [Bauldia litoralis]
MFETVSIPVWLLIVIGLLAAWAALDRLFMPSVRWFFRRRIRGAIEDARTRLHIDLPDFSLTKRQVLIDRLMYDPQVQAAAAEESRQSGAPRDVVMGTVARYAREIVPAFNAYFYFRLGYHIARGISRLFYRVRLGSADDEALRALGPNTTPVFVINHRSNMDYVLVAFLAAERTALSYAVGEWARIWPLQSLIKMLGGFFVRRGSGNPLYRKVLERYVAMASEGGVPQAVFIEGGLSRDGKLREPKVGLLDYILRGFDPQGDRDVAFIPVGINYDRVVEDRSLVMSLDPEAKRRSGLYAVGVVVRFLGRQAWLTLRGRWYRFGYAVVDFGQPTLLRDWLRRRDIDLAAIGREARIDHVKVLAADLMEEVSRVIPVLPVALVAEVFRQAGGPLAESEIRARALALMERLDRGGALTYIPRRDRDYAVTVGLRILRLRHFIEEHEGRLTRTAENRPLLDYYANSIAHLTAEAVPA